MYESSPSKDKNIESENENLLRDAEFVINSMWKKAMDVDDLPLSVDSSYQSWMEDLERRKSDFARVLFNKARESNGEEKLRSAQTLKHLTELINDSERQSLLKELMTTQETVDELVHQAKEQVKLKQTGSERMKDKLRKNIDRLLYHDDDFDKRLK